MAVALPFGVWMGMDALQSLFAEARDCCLTLLVSSSLPMGHYKAEGVLIWGFKQSPTAQSLLTPVLVSEQFLAGSVCVCFCVVQSLAVSPLYNPARFCGHT